MAVVFFSGELQELVGEEETRSEASIFIDVPPEQRVDPSEHD